MKTFLPPARPRLNMGELVKLLSPYPWASRTHPLLIVGLRGYYTREGNERGIYDDAICLVTDNAYAAFNANCDPSAYRKGRGTGAGKGMASLNTGYWPCWTFDLHQGKYLALCQRAAEVTVTRDGDPPYEDTGYFGINCHRGGYNTTSSAGCQTIHPDQWEGFINLATGEAKRIWGADWKRKAVVPYALIDA